LADDDTAEALGIKRVTHKVVRTIAMPKGGFKTSRVITKKVTLARVPGDEDDDAPPRMNRR
jgi:hypothetical protein